MPATSTSRTPGPRPCLRPTARRVAVVGGGPAGLTCAYYLVLKGYAVTLFEKSPELGGMLRYGIPEYRLPKKLLDKEISWITDLGVTVKKNSALGKDFSIAELKNQGFDAIYLAFGAQKAKEHAPARRRNHRRRPAGHRFPLAAPGREEARDPRQCRGGRRRQHRPRRRPQRQEAGRRQGDDPLPPHAQRNAGPSHGDRRRPGRGGGARSCSPPRPNWSRRKAG